MKKDRPDNSMKGVGPRSYVRSDIRIYEDINDALTDDHTLDARDVEVVVSQCRVTLQGTVASRGDRALAEQIARGVAGVRDVNNALEVREPGTPPPSGALPGFARKSFE